MDKEIKRKLYAEILDMPKTFGRYNVPVILDKLLAVDDMTEEDLAKKAEEARLKEIADLEVKKAEAEAFIAEATTKLSVLTTKVK